MSRRRPEGAPGGHKRTTPSSPGSSNDPGNRCPLARPCRRQCYSPACDPCSPPAATGLPRGALRHRSARRAHRAAHSIQRSPSDAGRPPDAAPRTPRRSAGGRPCLPWHRRPVRLALDRRDGRSTPGGHQAGVRRAGARPEGVARGVMLYEGSTVEGAPVIGNVSVGSASLPPHRDPGRPGQDRRSALSFFPDSALR